ncbi:MAG: thioredoxin family protein [Thiotrichales bacterium]
MRDLKPLAVLWIWIGFASLAWADLPEGYTFLRYDEALREAKTSGKPVFVYLTREGCAFCRKTNAESFVQPEVKARYTQHFILASIDTESDRRLTLPNGERTTEMQLATQMRVFGTPTFRYLAPDERLLHQATGFQTEAQLLLRADYVRGGHYEIHDSLDAYAKTRPDNAPAR